MKQTHGLLIGGANRRGGQSSMGRHSSLSNHQQRIVNLQTSIILTKLSINHPQSSIVVHQSIVINR